ncbi:MAG: enoyl-CoA hydratase-related protein [Rhodospirillaceae bacterium]|nr:enoyl-CoA hydratase-related protein [Rhodospirillaceae bacterium]
MPGNAFYEHEFNQENYDYLLIDKRSNGVVVATLNRPAKLNAVPPAMHFEIVSLTRDLDEDPDAKVLVITGAGRAFCAGGDASEGGPDDLPAARNRSPEAPWREGRRLVDDFLNCEKPIITAVNGAARGMGSTIALLGDIVIAARSATIADTHVRLAMGAGDGGQVLWPLLMGTSWAKYYMMTGDVLSAVEAEKLGLVNFVVDDDELMPRAMEIANRLAEGPSLAISASKVGINRYMQFVSNLVLPYVIALERDSLRSPDAAEAFLAFQEKRKPRFGRR